MLRAALWRRSGAKRRATRTASMIGQVLAGVLVVAAIVLFFPMHDRWSGAWILALGAFLFVAARSQWNDAADRPELLTEPVGGLRRELPAPLAPGASVADLEATMNRHPSAVLVPVLDDHGAVGSLVTRDAITRVPPAHRSAVPIRSYAQPLVSLPRVHPDESVQSVVGRLGKGRSWWALVVDGHGVEGVLCSEDVDAVLDAAMS